MKSLLSLLLLLAFTLTASARPESRLERHSDGSATLVVDGRPYIIIGGETGNSMASCAADINRCMADALAHGYNTVLIPVSWELIEPQKGRYDFASIDSIISAARAGNLRVVPLWFGAWKNSMSCYAPAWFKRDTATYPRAVTRSGRPLEIASAFSPAVYEADADAFRALLRHIADTDTDGTVIMIQIENEIGMLEDARDHSPLAQAEYDKGVPSSLMSYLKKHKSSLHPTLLKKWRDTGYRTSGSWAEVFGDDIYTDELFQAYSYALYVERLAREARKIFPTMPLYVNAAMNSRGRQPGQYPSGGPLAHLKDMWHAGSPTVDILAPDLYDGNIASWLAAYALADNPLFVPEIKATRANASQACYAVGEHHAIGLSPFAYNLRPEADRAYQREGNRCLSSLTPLLFRPAAKGSGKFTHTPSAGLYFTPDSTTRTIIRDGLRIRASHYFTLPWDPRATNGSVWPETGGLIIQLAPMDYIVAGSGIVLTFDPADSTSDTAPAAALGEDGFLLTGSAKPSSTATAHTSTQKRIGLASVEEVSVNPDGTLSRLRTLNGDETHQGRHVRIGVDEFKILHVTLYPY
ncbi:MAG: DUF5597 domain-containing protein [Duncaniella sp.]|nr:DUF5597 domain-containing protein [Duncaniella sp.]